MKHATQLRLHYSVHLIGVIFVQVEVAKYSELTLGQLYLKVETF